MRLSNARWPLLIAALLLLSGCVVSVGDRNGSREEAGWQERERVNRAEIARLEPGTPLAYVRERMGPPDFSEALQDGADEYRVLFYRTHRVRADGMTTRDETTPLVFANGVLTGWGEAAYLDPTVAQIPGARPLHRPE